MLVDATGTRKVRDTALRWLVGAFVVSALFSIPHSIFEGQSYGDREARGTAVMLATFMGDTRYLFEQVMYIAALIYIGSKFFETRTTFAVTFDRVDASKISVKGPDDDNVVWIGQRYGTPLEAQAVAATLENRLKENAA